jgi:hypothetical protein
MLLAEMGSVKGFTKFAKMRSPPRRPKRTVFPITYTPASRRFAKSMGLSGLSRLLAPAADSSSLAQVIGETTLRKRLRTEPSLGVAVSSSLSK